MNACLLDPVIACVVFAPLAFIGVDLPVSVMGYFLTAGQLLAGRA